MTGAAAAAAAHPNIALIKYWGNRDDRLRLPANGSISITLEGLQTVTRVRFDETLPSDTLRIDGRPASEAELARTAVLLDLVRAQAGAPTHAEVESNSDFPAGAGLASSASAFASLALAAASAAGLQPSAADLSRLARRGSGSACRSIFGGYVEWAVGTGDADSVAATLAPAEHWDLVDLITVVSETVKTTGSSEGHALAATSRLQAARVADSPRRLDECRRAVLERDFDRLAAVVEEDCHLMHAVMQTSHPPLLYWQPASLAVMHAVRQWRSDGIQICYTLDAGPNVHCLLPPDEARRLESRLRSIPGVLRVLRAGVGGPARLI